MSIIVILGGNSGANATRNNNEVCTDLTNFWNCISLSRSISGPANVIKELDWIQFRVHRIHNHGRWNVDRSQPKEFRQFNCWDRDGAGQDGETITGPFASQGAIINQMNHLQLANAHDRIVVPLETFRKEHIGGVKENKKLFYKKTAKYCQAQERCLAMSSKRPDNAVREVSWREEF